jgi:hypothetical protein
MNPNLCEYEDIMNHGIVYAYVNSHNMKMCIGQTIQPMSHRRRDHRQAAFNKNLNRPFYCTLRKYRMESFEEVILSTCEDQASLDASEKRAVEFFETTDSTKGYNLMDGGFSHSKHSEETKRKIGEASLRIFQDPAQRILMSEVGKKNYHLINNHEAKLKSGRSRHTHGRYSNGC